MEQEQSMNKQFQYQRIAFPATGTEALEKSLNVQGSDGWEAIFFERTQQGLSIIFKKETQGTYTIPEEERLPKEYVVAIAASKQSFSQSREFFGGWQTATSIATVGDPQLSESVSLEQAKNIIEKLKALDIPAYELEVF